jgi:hypothetical protein
MSRPYMHLHVMTVAEAIDVHVRGVVEQFHAQITTLPKLRSAYATRQENKETWWVAGTAHF